MADRDREKGSSPYPGINPLECKACGRCVDACPRDVLRLGHQMNERGYHYVEYLGEGCIGCAACYYVCPEPSAIEVHVPERKREPEA